MSSVFFSVVIPLFNKERYIERAIESVLKQGFYGFELIIVDDGSTDGSVARVESFNDPRLRLFIQSNQGEGPARNSGVKEACGKWVAFLDADDMWMPSHLACLKKAIDAFEGVGMVSSSSIEVENDIVPEMLGGLSQRAPRLVNYFSEASKTIGVINSSSVGVRRDVFARVGGFENYKMGCDLEFWARVALEYPVSIIDELTSVYFRGTGGVMESQDNEPTLESRRLPASLGEISPSVSMLSQRLNDLHLEGECRESVVEYINSRLVQAMRGALFQGDIARVKALRALCLSPLVGAQQRAWCTLARLPTFVLVAMSHGRALSKWIYLRLKR